MHEEKLSKLYEALERIANYRPDLVEPSTELNEEIKNCPDCKQVMERGWPPSGLCDHHYGRMSDEVWKKNERLRNTQHIYMRDIAAKAIAGVIDPFCEGGKTWNKNDVTIVENSQIN